MTHRELKLASAVSALVVLLSLGGCTDPQEPPKPTPASRVDLPDFGAISDVQAKKQAFFEFLDERVHIANDDVWAERKWVFDARAQFREGNADEAILQYVLDMADKYRVETADGVNEDVFNKLLTRVDIVPAPLVLAQAANESAWGTSRFSREGLNFFGVWCYKPGCGITPARRNQGATHEVRRYGSVLESVQHYVHTINSGTAYATLRQLRRAAREEGERPKAIVLAGGLTMYSERRDAYVAEIQHMIRQNRLTRFRVFRDMEDEVASR